VAGAVFGSLFLVFLVIAVVLWWRRRQALRAGAARARGGSTHTGYASLAADGAAGAAPAEDVSEVAPVGLWQDLKVWWRVQRGGAAPPPPVFTSSDVGSYAPPT
jgi:uncharacterized iron-regulated membrane protein